MASKDGKVAFRRIRGRIVPIRSVRGVVENTAVSGARGSLLGVQIGALGSAIASMHSGRPKQIKPLKAALFGAAVGAFVGVTKKEDPTKDANFRQKQNAALATTAIITGLVFPGATASTIMSASKVGKSSLAIAKLKAFGTRARVTSNLKKAERAGRLKKVDGNYVFVKPRKLRDS